MECSDGVQCVVKVMHLLLRVALQAACLAPCVCVACVPRDWQSPTTADCIAVPHTGGSSYCLFVYRTRDMPQVPGCDVLQPPARGSLGWMR